ncbi:single-stranded DNA-binding protein [Campylobacter concisus]|jgi:single-strand binding protein|uniref:single-stranded DNA-binding protein n=1 Tax=Campylobacter concisus TaxID=199 RepID=UPI000CD86D5F|nr:single-stranded DNA-binding protein [Campylobacter concisus]
MFNKIVLVGHLTRDIELRYTQGSVAIGSCGIAVTRKYTLNGEKREETCFVDLTFFGKQAEIANQYLGKGSKLLVEGRLKLDQWTDNSGQNRSKHSIAVESMEMLGDAKQNNQSYQQGVPKKPQQQKQPQCQQYSEPQYPEYPDVDSDEIDGTNEIPF